MKALKKYIVVLLLILFGIDTAIECIKCFTSFESSISLFDVKENKESEKDDDKTEKEKYHFGYNNFQSLSIELLSLINYYNFTLIHLVQPHIEVATPPPDFC